MVEKKKKRERAGRMELKRVRRKSGRGERQEIRDEMKEECG